jgi:tetratricopeptide (TPR) repeat protein
MKKISFLLIIFCLNFTAFSQSAKPTPRKPKLPTVSSTLIANDKDEFEKARRIDDLSERINAMRKFIAEFPNSELKDRASEYISTSYAQLAEEKLRLSEIEDGLIFFEKAAKNAPKPMSDDFFAKVALQYPTNLFWRGQQNAALKIAEILEDKVDGNARQMVELSAFYLGIENAPKAFQLTKKALALEPNLPAAHRTLGMTFRLNFQIDYATEEYAKSLELEPNSVASRIGLAELKRALGKFDEAIKLYNEVLEKDAENSSAKTGLILSMFDNGKQTEAEAELAKSLEKNPNNLFLTAGVAYWYASHGNAEKAIEYGQKAVRIEPIYSWGNIALARGYLLQNKPLEAEKVLLFAKNYGSFPTLDYEIASARLQAGFYEESATILQNSFKITDAGIETNLGGKTPTSAKIFTEVLAKERLASIFQITPADNAENAERLKNLLSFWQKFNVEKPSEAELLPTIDEFVKGNDSAKAFREIFIASRLLQKKVALAKGLELVQSASNGIDVAFKSPNATTSVLADELIEPRTVAISRQSLISVPNVPPQTLSNILRGRIEEISGRILLQQDKKADAVVRLRRAVGILPEQSAWWRSAVWNYGVALEANGKSNEALDTLIKYIKNSDFDVMKLLFVQGVYKKVYGNLNGYEQKVGFRPYEENAKVEPTPTPQPTVSPTPEVKENTEVKPTPTPETTPISTPTPTPNSTPKPLFEPVIIKVGENNQNSNETKPNCLTLEQDSISVINNGGSLGILVATNGEVTSDKISVTNENTTDINVSMETEIVKTPNRAYYIIKSISEKTGEFKVIFETSCGKKELLIKVR